MTKQLDPDRLADAMVRGARTYIDAALGPVLKRLEEAEARADAAEAKIAEMVAKAVDAIDIPQPKDGQDGNPGADGAKGDKGEAGVPGRGVAALLINADGHLVVTFSDGAVDDVGRVVGRDGLDGKDGKDGEPGRDGVDGRDGEKGADGASGRDGVNGRDGADGQDGKDADPEMVAELVRAEVEKAAIPDLVQRSVDAIPKPRDGVDGKDGATGPKGDKGDPGIAGKDGLDGKEGAPGKLPIARVWDGRVAYEGEVRTHNGSLWQATRDTGKEPGHEDWICLAAAGEKGRDASQIEVKGTYDPEATYGALNIVALNGGAFISRKDDPGPCPGEGWQVIAMRGKPGQPGEPGAPGAKGDRGEAGAPLTAITVDKDGLLSAVNGDGTMVECDLYPLLRQIGG